MSKFESKIRRCLYRMLERLGKDNFRRKIEIAMREFVFSNVRKGKIGECRVDCLMDFIDVLLCEHYLEEC